MASRHEIRARHTEEKQRQNPQELFKRNMAVAALVGVTAAAAIGVFAGTYYIDNGDITIDGDQITYYEDDKITQKTETDNDITITQHENVEVTDNTITIIADEDETVEVTIGDINIDTSKKTDEEGNDWYEAAISINGEGDVVLELDGENVVKSSDNRAGVETAGSGMLTIKDEDNDGSLNATGGDYAAGIGGEHYVKNYMPNITIDGGNITAVGGYGGAGIGGGFGESSNVTINGGTIEAIGNDKQNTGVGGAGIGNGGYVSGVTNHITINGGNITATGYGTASGIGSAGLRSEAIIEINGGKINAKSFNTGSGIGCVSNDATITISGGEITAEGSYGGAGIGSGDRGTSNVTITGGTINAIGGLNAAGIGGGSDSSATVTVAGGNVTATAGETYETNGEKCKRDPANSIGMGSIEYKYNGDTGEWNPQYNKNPTEVVVLTNGTIIEQPYGWNADGHTHTWAVSEYTAPTHEAKGVEISLCECGSKKTEFLDVLVPEEKIASESSVAGELNVTTLNGTAQIYEKTQEATLTLFAAPAEDAILTGSLGALAELKAQGATTLVFRTWQCETSVSIDKILAAGSEDAVFALTHKGTQAVLMVEGRVVE